MIFEKQITNLIEKKLNNPIRNRKLRKKKKDITYTFWWWVAKNIQDRKKFQHVCWKIADFYDKMPDNRILNLGISEIVVLNNTIFINLHRPGLIIGKGGENIDKLTEYINSNINGEKIEDYHISLWEDLYGWRSCMASYYHWKNNY